MENKKMQLPTIEIMYSLKNADIIRTSIFNKDILEEDPDGSWDYND